MGSVSEPARFLPRGLDLDGVVGRKCGGTYVPGSFRTGMS